MECTTLIVGLQRLSFAGKKFEDAERNLEHYGRASHCFSSI
jgi:hypothetical protein